MATEPEVLDRKVLLDLQLIDSALPGGVAAIVDDFARDGRATLTRLQQAMATSDRELALWELHRLKGASGNLAASSCAQRCVALESLVTTGDLTGATAELPLLVRAFDVSVLALRSAFPTAPTSAPGWQARGTSPDPP